MDFHPFIVHFPISLYFLAFFFEIIRKKVEWVHENISLLIFILASIFSVPSSFTGDSAKLNIRDTSGIINILENHENMGTIVTAFGILFSFFLVYMKLKYPTKNLSIFRKSIFLLMTLMVFYTGFLGGTIVHDFGVTSQKKVEQLN